MSLPIQVRPHRSQILIAARQGSQCSVPGGVDCCRAGGQPPRVGCHTCCEASYFGGDHCKRPPVFGRQGQERRLNIDEGRFAQGELSLSEIGQSRCLGDHDPEQGHHLVARQSAPRSGNCLTSVAVDTAATSAIHTRDVSAYPLSRNSDAAAAMIAARFSPATRW